MYSSKRIFDEIKISVSYATLKRDLIKLQSDDLVITVGEGRATKYKVAPSYDILFPVDVNEYFKVEIDEREIRNSFNVTLISEVLNDLKIYSDMEMSHLNQLQNRFRTNAGQLSQKEYDKELERLAIDLSWKSSQIEGNTYSLLETERLLKEKETAEGKTKDEAVMLLNHKDAIEFIIDDPTYFSPLTIAKIEDMHKILVKDLGVEANIRKRRVGITGTNYSPLDNEFQIKDALRDMCTIVNQRNNVFEKALLLLVLISYIQPFSDGNKRTARIISNAVLMANEYCPISFRTIDSVEYKKAMLVFYEQNNLYPFKEIFMDQFEFAVNTYF